MTEHTDTYFVSTPTIDNNATDISVVSAIEKGDVNQYWEHRAYQAAFIYCSPIIFIIGLFGNIFSFIVLQSKWIPKSAASFLLSVLAVTDLGCLLTELLNNWVKEITFYRIDIRGYNIHTCRLHLFLTFLCHHLSPMTLSFITVQRVICVYLPLKAKITMSRGNTIKVWSIIAVALTVFNSMAFFTASFDTRVSSINMNCFYNDEIIDFFNSADSVLESYMPCSIIIIGNILIAIKMNNVRIKRKNTQVSIDEEQINSEAKSMSRILIVITLTFVFLTTPFYVWVNGVTWSLFEGREGVYKARNNFAYAVTYHLLEFNFAVNFILYCAFGRGFRAAVRNLCKCCIFQTQSEIDNGKLTDQTGSVNTSKRVATLSISNTNI